MYTTNMNEKQKRAHNWYMERFEHAKEQNDWELRRRLLLPLARYIATGRPPQSHFLRSLLYDSLSKSIGNADSDSMANLKSWAQLLYTYVPAAAWGSREAVESWEGIEFVEEAEV